MRKLENAYYVAYTKDFENVLSCPFFTYEEAKDEYDYMKPRENLQIIKIQVAK